MFVSKLKSSVLAAAIVTASAFSTGIIPDTFCISEAQAQDDIVLNPESLAIKGSPKAIVTIVEFTDFQCPFCSRVNPTLDEIRKKYPKDVRIAYAPFPLSFHPNAKPAAKAAYAAQRQGKLWEMYNALFDNQNALSEDFFLKTARELRLDLNQFKKDMNSDKAENFIENATKSASKYGVTGTPSFVINGKLFVGAQPFDSFKNVIDAEINRAKDLAKSEKLSGDALYKKLVQTAPKNNNADDADDDDDEAKRVFIETGKSPVLGPDSALITIVEFSDYECPFCARANNTINELVKQYKGKVRVVFKHYPLPFHKHAKLAHQAAIAAGNQNKYWEMHEKLFQNQKALERDDIIQYAKDLKLDVKKFTKDMDSNKTAKLIEDEINIGSKQAGVRGTPHFLINGRAISGAQPIAKFQEVIDEEIEIAKIKAKKGIQGDKLYKEIVLTQNKNKPSQKDDDNSDNDNPKFVDIGNSPVNGPSNAKVTMVIFADFQCPFTKRVQDTIQNILNNPHYAKNVKFVFKHMPLPFHNRAHKAAEAAVFAHKYGKFWDMKDMLFENQNALKENDLLNYAKEVGLNPNKLKEALDNDTYAADVDRDIEQAKEIGVAGTPSFVINGKLIVGALPQEQFESAIDAALADAE